MPPAAGTFSRLPSLLLLAASAWGLVACQPETPATAGPPLRLVEHLADEACAYVSAAGDTVIPFGRYDRSVTPRFARVAVVRQVGGGWVGIDRHEQVLFRPYLFDNGPDYPAEGVLRVVDPAGRLGYADTATGRVVLPPRYDAAFPFDSGRARVGRRCRVVQEGEHSIWDCAEWYYIDHQGRRLPAPRR